MNLTTRLGLIGLTAVLATGLLAGCDRTSSWTEPGEQLPGWVYDAPYYYMPASDNELKATEIDPVYQTPIYYTRELVVPLKRPDASPSTCTPRLAVFYSDDCRKTWHKAGYFGIDQAFFSFVAPSEGVYHVRFAGPGIPPTRNCQPVAEHRIYHVDKTPPCVVVQVNPVCDHYNVGDQVTVSWAVNDPNIDPEAKVTIYEIVNPSKIRELGSDFPISGSIGAVIPEIAAACGTRFAVEATDKCGNVGRGFSFLILPPSGEQPTIPTPSTPPTTQDTLIQSAPPTTTTTTTPPTDQPPVTTNSKPSDGVQELPLPDVPLEDKPNANSTGNATGAIGAGLNVNESYHPKIYPSTQGD